MGSGEAARETLTPRAAAEERLLMGLRLAEGVATDALKALPGLAGRAETLAGLGLVEIGGGRLRATADGRPLLDAVLRELMA
jgi:oxygen-independent coproporphyrinogen-3 oxidase